MLGSKAPFGKQQWTVTAGPRQAKEAQLVLSQFHRVARTFITLSVVIGGETRSAEHWQPFSEPNPAAIDAYNLVGDTFGWVISVENRQQIIEMATASLALLAKNLPVHDERITAEEHQANLAAAKARNEAQSAEKRKADDILSRVMAKRPTWADRLIVAIEDIDDSDSMTDYFNHKEGRRVAIGWGKGKRENFAQLRAAAATFPETAHLGPGLGIFKIYAEWTTTADGHYAGQLYPWSKFNGQKFQTREEAESAINAETCGTDYKYRVGEDSIEHRENWSMGSGNYLKAGGDDSTGWRVTSYPVAYSIRDLTEDAIPDERPEAKDDQLPPTGISISENQEKGGVEIRFPEKPDESIIERLKSAGFHWSRFAKCWWIKKTDRALTFAADLARELSGTVEQQGQEEYCLCGAD